MRRKRNMKRLMAVILSMTLFVTDSVFLQAAQSGQPAVYTAETAQEAESHSPTGDGQETENTLPAESSESGSQAQPGESAGDQNQSGSDTEKPEQPGSESGGQSQPGDSTENPEQPGSESGDQSQPESDADDQQKPDNESGDQNPSGDNTEDPNHPGTTSEDPNQSGDGADSESGSAPPYTEPEGEPADDTEEPEGTEAPDSENRDSEAPEEEEALRAPQRFHEEAAPENYGTLTAYDDYSRTYHVEGNHYVTVIGNDGATYIDEEGNLRPVDNRLVENPASPFSTLGGAMPSYVNGANDYIVLFPESLTVKGGQTAEEAGADSGITLLQGDHMLTLYPAEGTFACGLAKDNAIRYSNVFPGIDYQYTVLGDSVKEDIILLEKTEKTTFSYFVDPHGLEATLQNNTLYLYQPGTDPETEAVFVLEAPEMEDAAGAVSFGVRMEMTQSIGGCLVTVHPDPGWLEAPERVYPVRIDPTAIQVTGSAIRIACAEEGSPNTVIGDNQYPYAGYDDGITSGNYAGFGSRHLNCRSYFAINYDFAGLAAEAEIQSASFQVYQKTLWSKGASEFGLYGVEEDWQVNSLTWNSQLAYTHYFLDAQNASATRGQALSFDVTEEVSAWINGTAQNHGFVLKAQVEAPNAETAAAGVKMQCEVFYNNSSARYAPKLILSWTGDATDLDALTLDDTTIEIYPVVERNGDKSTNTLGVTAHGLAKPDSTVHYQLINGATGAVVAQDSLLYPDSGQYAGAFPTALEYKRRLSNWQSQVFTNLVPTKHCLLHPKGLDRTVFPDRKSVV